MLVSCFLFQFVAICRLCLVSSYEGHSLRVARSVVESQRNPHYDPQKHTKPAERSEVGRTSKEDIHRVFNEGMHDNVQGYSVIEGDHPHDHGHRYLTAADGDSIFDNHLLDNHNHDNHNHDNHNHDSHNHEHDSELDSTTEGQKEQHDHDHDHDYDHADVAYATESNTNADKPWGQVIGATLIVNVVALSGIVFLIPTVSTVGKLGRCSANLFGIILPAFAAGALLAMAALIIFPEAASHLMAVESHDEHGEHNEQGDAHGPEISWKFGVSILGGFLLPLVLGAVFPHSENQDGQQYAGSTSTGKRNSASCSDNFKRKSESSIVSEANKRVPRKQSLIFPVNLPTTRDGNGQDLELASETESDTDKTENDNTDTSVFGEGQQESPKPVSETATVRKVDYVLCASVLIGDGFHNFADGIFIGTSFLLCSSSVSVSVVLATVYHEIAQEFADYVLLTKHAGLRPIVALALNFASGLLVLCGGLLVLAVDMSNTTIGVVLAISSGVYIQIAASECMPRVANATKSVPDRFSAIAAFIAGTVPIGLVLLNHPHC